MFNKVAVIAQELSIMCICWAFRKYIAKSFSLLPIIFTVV